MDRKTFLFILFRWFSLRFREITFAKNVGETEGFFCFPLNKRTAKKAARKLNVFCIHYFSKTKRKPAKNNTEKCFPINL